VWVPRLPGMGTLPSRRALRHGSQGLLTGDATQSLSPDPRLLIRRLRQPRNGPRSGSDGSLSSPGARVALRPARHPGALRGATTLAARRRGACGGSCAGRSGARRSRPAEDRPAAGSLAALMTLSRSDHGERARTGRRHRGARLRGRSAAVRVRLWGTRLFRVSAGRSVRLWGRRLPLRWWLFRPCS
jgi:hypothetical protein